MLGRPSSSAARDVDVHDHRTHIDDSAGGAFSALPDRRIADSARELHDTVMYFDADRAGGDIVVAFERGQNVILNLSVVLHQASSHQRQ